MAAFVVAPVPTAETALPTSASVNVVNRRRFVQIEGIHANQTWTVTTYQQDGPSVW